MSFIFGLLIIWLTFISSNGKESNAKLVPFPQQIVTHSTQLMIDSDDFKFIAKTKDKCEILDEAIKRYNKLSFIKDCSNLDTHSIEYNKKEPKNKSKRQTYRSRNDIETDDKWLTSVTIEVRDNCLDQWPHLNMDEMYTIRVDTEDFPKQAFIFSNSVWGALRALETFSQLIEHKSDSVFTINSTFIVDFPRFTYRGLLIDTSRHYLPLNVILENLDAMAFHKMNVLHWHIVDDQSFPYVSEKFPDLSFKGSYNPRTHVYKTEDINTVVSYARFRGIRVIAEFDTPGHSLSWGKAYPQLLTECYAGEKPTGKAETLNPSLNFTYDFLNTLLSEVVQKFSDNYLHLGGDEVNYLCWRSNPDIKTFMESMNISGRYDKLEEYFFDRLYDITSGLNKTMILWQEVFDQNINLPQNSVVNIWKEGDFRQELHDVTKTGHRAILSAPWYLNMISYGYDWYSYYGYDPQDFNGTEHQKSLVIGGQVSMWGEWVDGTNFISRTWPRSIAVAERLWSSKSLNNESEAQYRFVPNRCRMLERGLRFQPIVEPKEDGFGFCKCDYRV